MQKTYDSMKMIVRLWRVICTRLDSGEFHGLHKQLPHRKERQFAVWCPACPEPGVNMTLEEALHIAIEKQYASVA